MTIKLKVGSKYRNRSDEVVEIIGERPDLTFPFVSNHGVLYMKNGSALYNGIPSLEDIIEEVIEPARKPHKYAELIKAWADGTPLQKRYPLARGAAPHRAEWHDFEDDFYPDWEAGWIEYRIKPKNKSDVIWFINLSLHQKLNLSKYDSLCEANSNLSTMDRLAVIKTTITFTGDKPNLPDVEVISNEDALRGEKE